MSQFLVPKTVLFHPKINVSMLKVFCSLYSGKFPLQVALTELVSALDMPKSTISISLKKLEEIDLIRSSFTKHRREDGTFITRKYVVLHPRFQAERDRNELRQ